MLDALEGPAGAILFKLLDRPATEAELLRELGGTSQATANRRLQRLEQLRLIHRKKGRSQAPGRRWTLVHPRPTANLLLAALSLSELTAEEDAAARKTDLEWLKRFQRTRLR